MRAMSINAAPALASSCCAATWAAKAASAVAANDADAIIEISSAPAGINAVSDGAAAALAATAAVLISTSCAPITAEAGSCDMDVIDVLLPGTTAVDSGRASLG